jgi:HEAT repeats
VTLPKTWEDWSESSAADPARSIGFPFTMRQPLGRDDQFVQAYPEWIMRAAHGEKGNEPYNLWTVDVGSGPEKGFVVNTFNERLNFVKAARQYPEFLDFLLLTPSRAVAEGTSPSKDQITLDLLVQSDAGRLWDDAHAALDEQDRIENVKSQLDLFLTRYGERGVRSLSKLILANVPSGETAWTFLQMLGESANLNTARARREVLAAALESKDAALRYAAATALGSFGGADAAEALRKRLIWEKNVSVRRMIEAELS